jgi:hypothetical protein
MQGYLFSRPCRAAELERWHTQTVLPGKAPWMGVIAGQAV